jgi:hypothetical protein
MNMGLGQIKKVEAGSGDNRGHSGMAHRNKTECIKWVAKKKRRAESKR